MESMHRIGAFGSIGAVVVTGLAVALAGHATLRGSIAHLLQPASADELGDGLFVAHGFDAVRFALPLVFSRFALPASSTETAGERALLGALLGATALANLRLRDAGHLSSFALLLAVQSATYIGMMQFWRGRLQALSAACVGGGLAALATASNHWSMAAAASLGLATGFGARQLALRWSPRMVVPFAAVGFAVGAFFVPPALSVVTRYLLPVDEVVSAYEAVSEFVGVDRLGSASMEMLIVTANVQVPLGYLGIAYIRCAQERQNALLTVGCHRSSLSACGYVHLVKHWVLLICVPYVLQRTVTMSIHSHTFGRFRHWTERSLRLHSFFPDGGEEGTLLKAVAESNFTVEAYADAINSVVEVSFGILSDKLFTLPKLLLVPGVLATKPWLLTTVLPASMALDIGKAYLSTTLIRRTEALHRELMELASRRRRMELHDMKHEELIQRGHAARFAARRWRELGDKIEDRGMRLQAIQRLRGFVDGVYDQQLLGPCMECALAFLMEVGYITSSDIWLYTSVLNQAIGTLLTRQREQATLANMQTKLGLVNDLARHLARVRGRARPRCDIGLPGTYARISSLRYARGQARVHISQLELRAGRIFAVTGENGCGKSTALAIISSCGRRGAPLPAGAELLGSDALIVLPSDDVAEISQHFYCPLFTTPMAWLLQQVNDSPAHADGSKKHVLEARVVNLFGELGLLRGHSVSEQGSSSGELDRHGLVVDDLHVEKEEWYSELSGGERSKIEFIRKVFLRPRCPGVLLIDEAFAPLDPASRRTVQAKLKEFCSESLVLVVYHGGNSQGCLEGEGFFDDNLHFANGVATLVGLC